MLRRPFDQNDWLDCVNDYVYRDSALHWWQLKLAVGCFYRDHFTKYTRTVGDEESRLGYVLSRVFSPVNCRV